MPSLLLASIAGGCGAAPPDAAGSSEAAASPTATSDRASFDRARALADEGRLAESVALLEHLDDPRAEVMRALLLNRPCDARDVAREPASSELLEMQGIAAWRCGEPTRLRTIVDALRALRPDSASLPELEALSSLADLAPSGLRRVTRDVPMEARFDPSIGVPIIEVRVGDETARFLFDTGAELSLVTPGAAARFGARALDGAEVRVDANSETTTSGLAILPAIEVLGRTLEDVPVVVAELSFPPFLQLSGILGVQDLLSDTRIVLDYQSGVIHRDVAPLDEGDPIYFLDGRAVIGVEGAVHGGARGVFLVDTGGRRSTLVDRYVDRALEAGAAWELSTPERVTVAAVGTAERERRFLAQAEWCSRAAHRCVALAETPVDTTPADASTAQSGKLGADAFANRRVVLDYVACRMSLGD
ncbi:MAG: retropepsin-like aspartic protease [Sandaracinaceae bacterium]